MVRTDGHAADSRTDPGTGDLRFGQPGDLRGDRHLPGVRPGRGERRRGAGARGRRLVGGPGLEGAAGPAARLEVAPDPVHRPSRRARAQRDRQAAGRRQAGDRPGDRAHRLGGQERTQGAGLAAGNAVVFKPSEFTPAVGGWLVSSFAEIVPEKPVLQLITGAGTTGEALALSPVNKIAFTGSSPMARKVMATCAQNLTPMIAECGGKDALLVGPDANLDAAADAAAWGAVSNAGQTCIGVERVYVVDAVYHSFVEKLSERMGAARAGDDREASYGPMTMPGQLDVVEDHIADALARGGRAVLGGMQSIRRPYVDPVLLADVPEQSMAVQDETFGPTVTVTRVGDLAEAVELANASRFGLGSAVFAGNAKKAMATARALRSGMTSINSVIAYATVPSR